MLVLNIKLAPLVALILYRASYKPRPFTKLTVSKSELNAIN